MKTNKILSLIAAITLAGGTAMTPVLAEDKNQSGISADGTGTFNIGKVYEIKGDSTAKSQAETFYVEQIGNGSVSGRDVSTGEIAPALVTIDVSSVTALADKAVVGSVHYGELTQTSTEDEKTKDFTIGLPEYTKVGEYSYELAEVNMGTAGVTYASERLFVKVQVTNKADGSGLECNVTMREGSGTGSKVTGFNTEDNHNIYEAYSLTVKKNVTGNMGDKDKEFTINTTIDGETQSAAVLKDATRYASDETFGSKVYENIPVNTAFSVNENDYTAEADGGYDDPEYTYTVDGKKVETTPTTITATTVVEVTNNKGKDIDTGVITNNAPYIAIIGVVTVCAVVFFLRKRNVEE